MSKDYNLKTSTEKTKIMAFKGKHLVRSKIEIDGSVLEKVKQFNYLEIRTEFRRWTRLWQKNKQIPNNIGYY